MSNITSYQQYGNYYYKRWCCENASVSPSSQECNNSSLVSTSSCAYASYSSDGYTNNFQWISGGSGASGYFEYIGPVYNLKAEDVIGLFIKGDLVASEVNKHFDAHTNEITNVKTITSGNIIKYTFTYRNKNYTIACSKDAATSQLDYIKQDLYEQNVLTNSWGLTDSEISKYFIVAFSDGTNLQYAYNPNTSCKNMYDVLEKVQWERTHNVSGSSGIEYVSGSSGSEYVSGSSGCSGYDNSVQINNPSNVNFVSVKDVENKISQILRDVKNGTLTPEQACAKLRLYGVRPVSQNINGVTEWSFTYNRKDYTFRAPDVEEPTPEPDEVPEIAPEEVEETEETGNCRKVRGDWDDEEEEGNSIQPHLFDDKTINAMVDMLKNNIPGINKEIVINMIDEIVKIAKSKGTEPKDFVAERLVDFLVMRTKNPDISIEDMNINYGILHCDSDPSGVKDYLIKTYPSLFESDILNDKICAEIGQRAMDILVSNRSEVSIDETAFLKICIDAQVSLIDSANFLGYSIEDCFNAFLSEKIEIMCENYTEDETVALGRSAGSRHRAPSLDNIPDNVKQQFYASYGTDLTFTMESDHKVHVYQGDNSIGTVDIHNTSDGDFYEIFIKDPNAGYKAKQWYIDEKGICSDWLKEKTVLMPDAFWKAMKENSCDTETIFKELFSVTDAKNMSDILYKLFKNNKDIFEKIFTGANDDRTYYVRYHNYIDQIWDNIVPYDGNNDVERSIFNQTFFASGSMRALLDSGKKEQLLEIRLQSLFFALRNPSISHTGRKYWTGRDKLDKTLFNDNISQGGVGDCWYVADLLSGAQNPDFTNYVSTLIDFGKNDFGHDTFSITIQGKTYKNHNSRLFMEDELSNGDPTVRIFEMAAREYFYEKYPDRTNPVGFGGWQEDTVDFLCGDKSIVSVKNSKESKPKGWWDKFTSSISRLFGSSGNELIDHMKSGEYMSSLGTSEKGLKAIDSETGKEVDIVTHHAYAVVGASNDFIYIKNPWDSAKTLKLSREVFENNKFQYEEVKISTLIEKMKYANEHPETIQKENEPKVTPSNNNNTTQPELPKLEFPEGTAVLPPDTTTLPNGTQIPQSNQTPNVSPNNKGSLILLPGGAMILPDGTIIPPQNSYNNTGVDYIGGTTPSQGQGSGTPWGPGHPDYDFLNSNFGYPYVSATIDPSLLGGTALDCSVTGSHDYSYILGSQSTKVEGQNPGIAGGNDSVRETIESDAMQILQQKYGVGSGNINIWWQGDKLFYNVKTDITTATTSWLESTDDTSRWLAVMTDDNSSLLASLDGGGTGNGYSYFDANDFLGYSVGGNSLELFEEAKKLFDNGNGGYKTIEDARRAVAREHGLGTFGISDIDQKIADGAYINPDGSIDEEQLKKDIMDANLEYCDLNIYTDKNPDGTISYEISLIMNDLSENISGWKYNAKTGENTLNELEYFQMPTLEEIQQEFLSGIQLLERGAQYSIDQNLITGRMQSLANRITQETMKDYCQNYIDTYLDGYIIGNNILNYFDEKYHIYSGKTTTGGWGENTYTTVEVSKCAISNYITDMWRQDEEQGYNQLQQLLRMQDRLCAFDRLSKQGYTGDELEYEYEKLLNDGFTRDYSWLSGNSTQQIIDQLGEQNTLAMLQAEQTSSSTYDGPPYILGSVSQQDAIKELLRKYADELNYSLKGTGYSCKIVFYLEDVNYLEITDSKHNTFKVYLDTEYRQKSDPNVTEFLSTIMRLRLDNREPERYLGLLLKLDSAQRNIETDIKKAELKYYEQMTLYSMGMVDSSQAWIDARDEYVSLVTKYQSPESDSAFYLWNTGYYECHKKENEPELYPFESFVDWCWSYGVHY